MEWLELLNDNISTAEELSGRLKMKPEQIRQMQEVLDAFPMNITGYYLDLIDWDHPEEDPVLRMCVPSIRETDLSGQFDTSGEADNTVMRAVQHKYRQTVLILSTQMCAMYCRHCFRKRLVGIENESETRGDIPQIAAYVREHEEVTNVLISGGDAFMNSDEIIGEYLKAFSDIEHLDLIRFGTRMPVVLPERIYGDQKLLELLREYGRKKQIYVVTQFNHPKEITKESARAVSALMDSGVIVRNQTVLLKGVNDDPKVLGTLTGSLTGIGVVPYYIFQCRPVSGVKNQFQLPIMQGYGIVEEAKQMLNGQGKSLRYIMSHPTGKIEILGPFGDGMLFKYHQAKDERDLGRIFSVRLRKDQRWLDEECPYRER